MSSCLTHIPFPCQALRKRVPWVVAFIGLLALMGFDQAECRDTIYFKDGMRMVCQTRAWEENDEVYCEYEGGLLIYPKRDVGQILKGPPVEEDKAPPKNHEQESKRPAKAASSLPPPPATVTTPAVRPSSGVLFYDPRRPKKYWSSQTGHYDSYRDAIAALAAEFDRSPQWIEDNMGDSNDLEEIRDRLSAAHRSKASEPTESPNDLESGGIEFYNPRRPQKYWTAPEAGHNTYAEAIAAFAREFGKPAAWIEAHMGDSNDLEQIRHALRNAQMEDKDQ